MIENPVLKGFCPDPSIIRVGRDYYIAVSTFEWWPGVRLFHSRDLCSWKQIVSPLRRRSQLDLVGDPCSGGVWAPCLSYDGERFFLVYTDVKTKKGMYYNTHNYLVYTEDIEGEWSNPLYLNSVGFDPSLFHDRDGRKYLVNMINGFRGILVQERDPKTLEPAGKAVKVYDGSGRGCTEGPHIYHIGEWYYLLTAEGGTGYDHCVTMARSKSVWGPYEPHPCNPILTSDRENPGALQKCGHGDLVHTPEGECYMVHLCARPLREVGCVLGRETAVQRMEWRSDGWLYPTGGIPYGRTKVEAPGEMRGEVCAGCGSGENGESRESMREAEGLFRDDFAEGDISDRNIALRYASPREDYSLFADCRIRPGYMRLRGRESLNSLHHVSLLAVRQQRTQCAAETRMEYVPECREHLAGLAYVYDALNFYVLGKTLSEEGEVCLVLLRSDGGNVEELGLGALPSGEAGITIRLEVRGEAAGFSYRLDGGEWCKMGEQLDVGLLTDEHCRGFTGAHFGLYAHDMRGMEKYADYEYFEVKEC